VRSVSRERVLENFCSFAVLGEDDDLGQTIIKGKNRYIVDSAKRKKSSIAYIV
jgi:hypothetical protein